MLGVGAGVDTGDLHHALPRAASMRIPQEDYLLRFLGQYFSCRLPVWNRDAFFS